MYLYGLTPGEEPVEILNWLDCDINGDSLDSNSICLREDGRITGLESSYSRDSGPSQQLFTLNQVPASSVAKKEVLTVAQLQYYDYELGQRIVKFNRSHEDVRLELKDYMQYNTEEDPSAGLTKFTTELMAGNGPDIIPMNSVPYRQLASRGLLEDLYPFIEADDEIRREDFFPNLLEALEVDGGLYQACSDFSVETLIGAGSIVGNSPGWTYEDFYLAWEKMPEDCTILEPWVTRQAVLSSLLGLEMDQFVDWSSGEVHFESQAFKDLMEFTMLFPESFDWSTYELTESTNDLIRQGRQMLTQTYLYGLDSLLYSDSDFGGSATYIGWPCSEGVGSILMPNGGYGMSHNCRNKEAAWDFLRTTLTEDGQRNTRQIPVNQKIFREKLEEIMTVNYQKDSDGNEILNENGEKIPIPRGTLWMDDGETRVIYAMTQEQADAIVAVAESCKRISDYDSSIYDIVSGQAMAWYSGEKSLDEVCRLIQSRANLYINEQR